MSGPPYRSTTANIGGVPTVPIDVPICAVFIVLFVFGAICHMTLLVTNSRRGHRFRLSGMLFGYNMARITTCVMRIVWATRKTNVRIAIAANVFSNAGVFIAFIVNLVLAQRLCLSVFPGLRKTFKTAFTALYVLVVLILAASITAIVQSVYTLRTDIHRIDRDIQLTAITMIFVIACLPLPLVLLAVVAARRHPPLPFGAGSWNGKVMTLMTTTLLAVTVAGFRLGTTWETPRAATDPAWYDARWCYYFFNFVMDIAIIYAFLVARIDKRFHTLSKEEEEARSRSAKMES
ncbi:hypothetical protein M8818_000306 [Zalaria obscura]|uniref:Uncharacterized protein n=1 Tax=Zalaria obscura TaxID=2024903 RepID=A0ACC3SSD0_9PEZI